MGRRIVGLLAAAFLAGTACGRVRGGSTSPDATASAKDVTVYVTNNWELPMEIHALGGGATHRLGLVAPSTTRSFVLPQTLVGNGMVMFRAQPAADPRFVQSEELQIRPGHIVDFVITINLFDSRATIRM